MNRRVELQYMLEDLLGSKNVYFQPPENKKIDYPCFIYARTKIATEYANNNVYKLKNLYTITVIDRNPDSDLPRRIAKLPTAKFSTSFTKDNLNHNIFTIHY